MEKEVVDSGKVSEEETVDVVDRVEETVKGMRKAESVAGEKKVVKSIRTSVKYPFLSQPKSQDKFHQVWHLEN